MRSCFQDPRNLARTGAAVVALVLLAASLPPALRADSYQALQGYVFSCDTVFCKEPAANVDVEIEPSWGVQDRRVTRSDRSGHFAFLGVEPGRYAVSAGSDGLMSSCLRVDVVPDETAFVDLTYIAGAIAANGSGCWRPVMRDSSSYLMPEDLYSRTLWYW